MRIVIRAGGIGTRLWPWSRSDRPKQFLPLFSGKSPVQLAWERFSAWDQTSPEDIFVSVGKDSLDLALEQLPGLPADHIICEPALRDTAAAVGLETIYVAHKRGPGIIASLGSDHYVGHPDVFLKALSAAEQFIERNPDYLVAIACEPTRVETNYGHLRKGEQLGEFDSVPIYQVAGFTEKPEYRRAEEYTRSGEYLWNANFFVWSAETLLRQFREYEPTMYEVLIELEEAIKQPEFRNVVRSVYPRLKKVAIDYAVLEPAARAGRMAVVPAAMEWSDIGSWATLTDAFPADEDGNLLMGPVLADDTRNTTVFVKNPDRQIVATIGLEDLIIVDTKDALLVCPKDQSGKVKRIVEEMRKNDQRRDLL